MLTGFALAVILSFFPDQAVDAAQMMRYATAMAEVIDAEDLPFQGKWAKEKTIVLLSSVTYQESGFREDIEFCRFQRRPGMTEDDGRSAGLTQLFQGVAWQGYSREQICGNASRQFQLALRYLTSAMHRCKSIEGALSAYNANVCYPTIYSGRVGHSYRRTLTKFQSYLQENGV